MATLLIFMPVPELSNINLPDDANLQRQALFYLGTIIGLAVIVSITKLSHWRYFTIEGILSRKESSKDFEREFIVFFRKQKNESLLEFLRHEDENVRLQAHSELRYRGVPPKEITKKYIEALSPSSPYGKRIEAAKVLGELGYDDAIAPLKMQINFVVPEKYFELNLSILVALKRLEANMEGFAEQMDKRLEETRRQIYESIQNYNTNKAEGQKNGTISRDTKRFRQSLDSLIERFNSLVYGFRALDLTDFRGKVMLVRKENDVVPMGINTFVGNRAMLGSLKRLGGIALNSKLMDFQVKRDGHGVALSIGQQDMSMLDIQGLVPRIISIHSINLSVLFGIN